MQFNHIKNKLDERVKKVSSNHKLTAGSLYMISSFTEVCFPSIQGLDNKLTIEYLK